ncbi:hypothetical protein BDB00DRAFT_938870 [Zychaea mexicana]|uniref:uncharacterized protein n=1 Tax=Zychaea mexicana TaxID=64656 RepID=UPI0022FE9CEA|nr:uncharacterized protein BDB00DRAFT_938870 [Zychaea mexicana]KAI9493716.1 hypothetical protein BDB00DRAFT_938870 [Zychaea mexicana]
MLKICTLGCVREQLGYKQNPATSGDRAITYNQKSFLNAIRHYQALHKRKHVFFQNKGCVAVDIKHRRLFKAPSVIVGRRRRVATTQCVALFKPRETTSRKRARSCDGSANDFTDSTSAARVGARNARGVSCCGRVGN